MAPREIKPAARPNEAEAPVNNALRMIPVTAADVAREKRRKVLTGIGIVLVLLVTGAWLYKRFSDPRDAREAYEAGLRLLRATRYEQAALNFTRAVDLQPDFVDAYRMRGRVNVAVYNPDPAIRDFSKVLDLAPNDPIALMERGFAWLDKKDYQNAMADADRAISLEPGLGRAYNLRATAWRAIGDSGKAITDFTTAVKLDPSLANYFQRGSTYQVMGQHTLAIADFDSAIAYDPTQPHIYFARAQSRAAVGDGSGASDDIATGRKIDGW